MNIQEKINQASFPIVVTASAGTGKTYSLVEKVKYSVEKGINPINMLIFTFTVDAALELKKRVKDGQLMTIGTMHSVMYQIIRENSKKRYFVLDSGAQTRFIMDIFKEMKIDFDKLSSYTGAIGMAKNTYTDYYDLLENSPQLLEEYFGNAKILSFAMEYEKKKEKSHKIDFDDMTLKAHNILLENPSILDNRQERWKYIFVDEAQDLCPPQIDVVKLLGNKYKNLFVVGDEKQAIYGSFRASTPDYLKNFGDIYKNANKFSLPTTYRCAKNICDAGNKIASYIDKTVIDTASTIPGKIFFDMDYDTQSDEAEGVCKLAIQEFNKDKTVKILYRTNAQSLSFQRVLIAGNIPFSISQVNSIFYSKEAKVAIACANLRFEYASMEVPEKVSVLNSLRPLLSNKWGLYEVISIMKKQSLCPFESPELFQDDKCWKVHAEIMQLEHRLKAVKSISEVFALIAKIIDDDDSETFTANASDNIYGMAEFFINCKSIREMEELIMLIQKPRNLAENEKAISLSTIHGSKGLEADIVFLTGVVDDILPHKRGIPNEELNLFYVGVTRARQELYVSGFIYYGKNIYEGRSYSKTIGVNNENYSITTPAIFANDI
jgi:DNA helicase-2/ATP-dependent DNA helicase PcrA